MKTYIIIAVLLFTALTVASAQNYSSLNDGNWTTASLWNNTSGWGTSTPPIDGSHGSGTIAMNNNMTISGAYNIGSATLNINASKSLTVNGAMTLGGGSAVNVSGSLSVYGDLTLNSTLNILPGGIVKVYGNLIVNSSNYLIVGTNANPPPYADLVVKNDLKQNNSGDVTLNKSARVAVFGNVKDDGNGGTFLKLKQGAEMYVNGNIAYTGGGNDIDNNNAANPYGLYVNGSTSNNGGGSATTTNKANKATMQTTNPTFSSWVDSQQTLMPVTMLFFEVGTVTKEAITLKWATATEENFDYFIIESSTDGAEFTELGRVAGHGNTKMRYDYKFEVTDPVVGKSYFRLKSVDFDGNTETFKVVSATFESTKTVTVFPNPVVDSNVNIDFNFDPSEEVSVAITNLTGTEVLRQSVNGMSNLLTLSIEAGTYLIKVSSTEVSFVSRIVVK